MPYLSFSINYLEVYWWDCGYLSPMIRTNIPSGDSIVTGDWWVIWRGHPCLPWKKNTNVKANVRKNSDEKCPTQLSCVMSKLTPALGGNSLKMFREQRSGECGGSVDQELGTSSRKKRRRATEATTWTNICSPDWANTLHHQAHRRRHRGPNRT